MYRHDYDIAVGVSGQTAKETARREITEPTEPIPYTNSYEFAIWCKTVNRKPETGNSVDWKAVDWKEAAALASARMTGRVWAWVHAIGELQPGDHVALNFGAVYYYQHAVVSSIEGNNNNNLRSLEWQKYRYNHTVCNKLSDAGQQW